MQRLGIAGSVRIIALAAWSCVAASMASAQSDTTAGHRGLHFALGGAEATTAGACSGCTGYGQSGMEYSLMLRVGGAVLPNIVLSADLDMWEFDRPRGSESGTWELVTAQYYPSLHRGLYVSAGIGLAQVQIDPNNFDFGGGGLFTRHALGLAAGIGYDLHVSGSFFLTPSIDMLYAQQLGSATRGTRQVPAVIRAGVSVVREPHGAIAREESKKDDGHHGLEVALGVGEGVKPGSCAGCAGWGAPAGGAVFQGRAGWAVSPSIVVSADVTGWQRGVGRANESVVWQMITTQYYPNPRAGLYFEAGAGRTVDDFHVDGFPSLYPPVVDATTHTLGLSVGIGYEDKPRSFFSMTPSLNVLYAMPQRETNTPGGARVGTTLICAGIALAWR